MILRHSFTPPNNTRLDHLCGPMDAHLRTVETALQVQIAHRHEQFKIDGLKAKAQRAMGLGLGAVDLELLVAVRDADLQAGLDGAKVFVHRPAQMGQAGVVGRREGVADDQADNSGEQTRKLALCQGTP